YGDLGGNAGGSGRRRGHCAPESFGGGRSGDRPAPEGDAAKRVCDGQTALQEKGRAAPWRKIDCWIRILWCTRTTSRRRDGERSLRALWMKYGMLVAVWLRSRTYLSFSSR